MKKLLFTILLLFTLISSAFADTISFQSIFNTDWTQDSYYLDINSNDTQTTLFFYNKNTRFNTFITGIYFIDNYEFEYNNSPSVVFYETKKPRNFPGGNIIGFDTTLSYLAKSPSPQYGINYGESFTLYTNNILFNELKIGIHVQSICNSDSLILKINNTPEPTSSILFASVFLLPFYRRIKNGKCNNITRL